MFRPGPGNFHSLAKEIQGYKIKVKKKSSKVMIIVLIKKLEVIKEQDLLILLKIISLLLIFLLSHIRRSQLVLRINSSKKLKNKI